MRKTLLLTMAILLCASLVLAQPGSIGVFADVNATICNLAETEYINVFVVHVNSPGATQSKFKLVQTHGANMIYWGDTVNPAYSSVGNNQTGITITYPTCTASPHWIASAHYLGNDSAECSRIQVVAHPDETTVLAWDCADPPNAQVASGGRMHVNPNAWCNCTVPVWETTWGQIKSLYGVE